MAAARAGRGGATPGGGGGVLRWVWVAIWASVLLWLGLVLFHVGGMRSRGSPAVQGGGGDAEEVDVGSDGHHVRPTRGGREGRGERGGAFKHIRSAATPLVPEVLSGAAKEISEQTDRALRNAPGGVREMLSLGGNPQVEDDHDETEKRGVARLSGKHSFRYGVDVLLPQLRDIPVFHGPSPRIRSGKEEEHLGIVAQGGAAPSEDAYPPTESLYDIVKRWNPDEPDGMPVPFQETLQMFNYSNPVERAMAERYRDAELPFKLYDVPEVDATSARWTDTYLNEKISAQFRAPHVEESSSNHFMFWSGRSHSIPDWRPPTKNIRMSFAKWLEHAKAADRAGSELMAGDTHYYFMLGTQKGQHRGNFISEDLPYFSTPQNNFFITSVKRNKGIQCRFGERGVTAEAHYDAGKNFVAMIRGAKRYILAPPSECANLGIITSRRHPSFRHSDMDWSDEQQAKKSFQRVKAIDTVVRTGELLYIPSYWFHYISSLNRSCQCNSRSGAPLHKEGEADIEKCLGGVSPRPPRE